MPAPLVMPGLWLSADRAETCTAPVTGGGSYRNAALLRRIADQFGLGIHPRYAAGLGQTWCNLFLSDFTRACGCEIPRSIRGVYLRAFHQILWLRGELRWRDLKITPANGIVGLPELLPMQGAHHGWHAVDAAGARARAALGQPTVIVWRNPHPDASSHVGAVMPSSDGTTMIAQAGATCFGYGPASAGFGDLEPLEYFSHA